MNIKRYSLYPESQTMSPVKHTVNVLRNQKLAHLHQNADLRL